jgi:hypothetical protein
MESPILDGEAQVRRKKTDLNEIDPGQISRFSTQSVAFLLEEMQRTGSMMMEDYFLRPGSMMMENVCQFCLDRVLPGSDGDDDDDDI